MFFCFSGEKINFSNTSTNTIEDDMKNCNHRFWTDSTSLKNDAHKIRAVFSFMLCTVWSLTVPTISSFRLGVSGFPSDK